LLSSAKDLVLVLDDLLGSEVLSTLSARNSNTFSDGFRFLLIRVPTASSVNNVEGKMSKMQTL